MQDYSCKKSYGSIAKPTSSLHINMSTHHCCSTLLIIISAHLYCSSLLLISISHHCFSLLLLIFATHRYCSSLLLISAAHRYCSSLVLIYDIGHLLRHHYIPISHFTVIHCSCTSLYTSSYKIIEQVIMLCFHIT